MMQYNIVQQHAAVVQSSEVIEAGQLEFTTAEELLRLHAGKIMDVLQKFSIDVNYNVIGVVYHN
jgi:hypothetical protein